jgi:hypothetical protein
LRQINKQQIEDWTENPVTIELRKLVEGDLEEIRDTEATDCIFRGDPQRTQENLVDLVARELDLVFFIDLLSGEWSYFEEEEDEDG